MSKVLFFHTSNLAEIINVNEKDGSIIIGDKKFYVDEIPKIKDKFEKKGFEVSRVLLKTKFGGYEPLYFLKWDCLYPGKLFFKNISKKELERKEEIERIKNAVEKNNPVEKIHLATIIFNRDVKNIPESLYRSERLKILGGMFKVKKEVKGVLYLIFGIMLGVIIFYLMLYLKLIKI